MIRAALLGFGLVGLAAFGLVLFVGPKALAYTVVNALNAGPQDSALQCTGTGSDNWRMARFRAEAPDGRVSITRVPGAACAISFTVRQGQRRVKRGVRTELRTNPARFGLTERTCFTATLPQAWANDHPPVTLAQWHAVPDRPRGEEGRSPPLRLMVLGDAYVVMSGHDARALSSQEPGQEPQFADRARVPVRWGVPERWCFDVLWQQEGRGAFTVTHNGAPLVTHDGALGFNDWVAPFVKFGVYVPGADEAPGAAWTAEFADVSVTTHTRRPQ